MEGEFYESISSILYETASINFIGPSQASFQTSVPYHMSWCRINTRLVAYGPPRDRGGLGRRGLRRPENHSYASGPWRSRYGGGDLDAPLTRALKSPLFLSRPRAKMLYGSSNLPYTPL